MNRRELVRGLLALPLAGVIASCKDKENDKDNGSNPLPAKLATLRVVLQGPFAVVLMRDQPGKGYPVKSFIPSDPAHEFRFPMPTTPVEKSYKQYHFTLSGDGLEPTDRPPRIDSGFYDFNVDFGKWDPNARKSEYFISLDLPAPDSITFIPPAAPVLFEDGNNSLAPLNHVLEYRVRDISKVVLKSDELKAQKPLSCSELYNQYKQREKERDYKGKPPNSSPRPDIDGQFGPAVHNDVYVLFLGVGVQSNYFTQQQAEDHGVEFFNRLLTFFPNAPNINCKRLAHIYDYKPCPPENRTTASELFMPTVLRESVDQPRLLRVTAAIDCRAPGLLGTSP